jgi:hypothetical protein
MSLPREIPPELLDRALEVPDLARDEGAWTREDALAVVESLGGTTVAIEAVSVCEIAPVVHRPPVPGWAVGRLRGEASADYARRSRAGASRFIASYAPAGFEEVAFILEFSTQDEAA